MNKETEEYNKLKEWARMKQNQLMKEHIHGIKGNMSYAMFFDMTDKEIYALYEREKELKNDGHE